MVKMPYWMQRADFTSTDYEPVEVEDALRIARSHDWPRELQLQQEREAGGLETCPPGIGFVDSDNRILHVCPGSDGTVMIHYHFSRPRVPSGAARVLLRLAIVTLSGVIGWQFLGSWSDLARASIAAATGLFAVLVLWDTRRRLRTNLPVRFEPVVLTRCSARAADVPELIRRFFDSDHAWLEHRLGEQ